MTEFWLTLRIIDLVLYGGVLSGLVKHSRHLRIPDWRGFRFFIWGFFASCAYASVELIRTPGGPRLFFLSVALLGLFIGCWMGPIKRRVEKRRNR